MNIRQSMAVLVTAATWIGLVGPAQAQQTFNLTIGSSHPVFLPFIAPMKNFVQPEINRRLAAAGNRYQIKWREAYGGTLYKANATLTSVSDGITDVGWVFANVEGSRMPLGQVSTFAPGVTSDYRIMAEVHNELMANVAPLKAEWEKHNAVFLGAMAADSINLFTKFPVNSLADLRGKKIAAAGTIGSWLAGVAAVPVDGALPTFYEQISQGVAEGGLTIATGVLGIKLYEVTPIVTLTDLGTFYAGGLAINKDTFNRLPPEVQKIFREVGHEYTEKNAELVDRAYQNAMKVFKSAPGVEVRDFPQSERVQWIQNMPNIAQDWAKANEAKGLPAREVLSAYMDAMRKRGAKPIRDWDKN